METNNKNVIAKEKHNKKYSLKGTLFSSIVFVGGTIIAFILLLWVLYMVRI
ncbi:hypothetical protein GT022_15220 [Agaribacter marinus]|uniref:Cytochrome c oxidase subunit 2A n=1 Tax=Virgibacillus salarius TaxID=447199 RepID=A0A941DV91_9BACI|nr:hypothetical protein [Virgibacillus salarius]MBR7797390.1 hypothetical protein [Virgibacillus salarius]NAZ10100.1 hypothetical protein [Agaribacter marinus]WBX79433.1 hypothetical protein PD280_17225 [Virgibacillus salarius]